MTSTQSDTGISEENTKDSSVVFHAHCWKFDVLEGSVLAKEWPQQNRGIVCEIEVRRPESPKQTPYKCTLKQVKNGNTTSMY